MSSDEPAGYASIPINASHPKMQSAWHVFDPECIYWAPRHVQSLWGARRQSLSLRTAAAHRTHQDFSNADGDSRPDRTVLLGCAAAKILSRVACDPVPNAHCVQLSTVIRNRSEGGHPRKENTTCIRLVANVPRQRAASIASLSSRSH
jgi:beta-glucosidase